MMEPVRKLILTNFQSPGDGVMLTAAVRDLHRCYPGQFITGVRTSYPALWDNNPYLTPLDEKDPEVETIVCGYPLIHRSSKGPFHFIHGFIDDLNRKLGLSIEVGDFKGDIHLAPDERRWMSQVREITGDDRPFWIIAAGGKFDFTIKWWDHARYQAVVDRFGPAIQFVQIGQTGHHHPALEGVIDLRGKTSLRQLIRLTHHAAGVITPVSLMMHLAAAVDTRAPRRHRACVVVAGGREPVNWEAYPQHQFLHTIGALDCCRTGGCWRSRTVPIGDGDPKDQPDKLCLDVVGALPRCMDLITAEDVIRRVALYTDPPAP
jgi:ADP-heptose:LPS heptosyltransferase